MQTPQILEEESQTPFPMALEALKRLRKGDNLTVTGLKGSSLSYLLSSLFKETRRPLLLLLPDTEEAEKTCDDVAFFVGDEKRVFYYPPWEVLPYDEVPPYPEIMGRRLDLLFRLLSILRPSSPWLRRATKDEQGGPVIVVTTPKAVMQKVFSGDELSESVEFLRVGGEVEMGGLAERLVERGYRRADMVEEIGDMGIRGGILDLFPPNQPIPIRVEFIGDEIESIRTFDPETQRSVKRLEEVTLLPLSEQFPATRLSSFFDYLSNDFNICIQDRDIIEEEAERFEEEVMEGWKGRSGGGEDVLSPDCLYLTRELFLSSIYDFSNVFFEEFSMYRPEEEVPQINLYTDSNRDIRRRLDHGKGEVLEPLAKRVKEWLKMGWAVHFVARTSGEGERLRDILNGYDVYPSLREWSWIYEGVRDSASIIIGGLNRGLRIPSLGLVIITEEEIFGERIRRRHVPTRRVDTIKLSLGDIKEGDLTVHVDHGVGIYRGLKRLKIDGVEGDYLHMEYLGGDRLYVPVFNLNVTQKYIGGKGAKPPIDKLGGMTWEKAKARVKEATQKVAKELLDIYAARKTLKGFAFSTKDRDLHEFEAAFEHEETPDQINAIEDVLKDMESSMPTDRLVCGDVGYGKTEVALRASFKAVWDGKQVALLVPTTVLAQQHFETFKGRFAPYPVNVEVLSRFKTMREQKNIVERVSRGEVDILIGTHRIIQEDVGFKDLGLVIIDEEQRFGVSQKEKFKEMKKLVDCLVLTATPIPRTLHMALGGLRDLSIINTPPEDRLSIKTFILRFDKKVIKDAIRREMDRGGQVFFVHNRVHSIGAMARFLRRLIPEARLGIAHGQMEKGKLERVMISFLKKEYEVLLCTSLIESGLDIPTANTIIINRADRFGLAQLYQLRGRVGRSHHRAYAYLLVPSKGALTTEAKKRLGALEEMSDLGSGFRLATHDLEIRGAGELLGTAQSGQIARVGFEMYTRLLEEAVAELKGEECTVEIEPEMKIPLPSYIPENYIPDPKQRLIVYKKLATSESTSDLDDLVEEVQDRYGKIPLQVRNLFSLMEIKHMAKTLMVREITLKMDKLTVSFHERSKVSPGILIEMVMGSPQRFHLTPDHRLTAILKEGVPTLEAIRKVLKPLLQGDNI